MLAQIQPRPSRANPLTIHSAFEFAALQTFQSSENTIGSDVPVTENAPIATHSPTTPPIVQGGVCLRIQSHAANLHTMRRTWLRPFAVVDPYPCAEAWIVV